MLTIPVSQMKDALDECLAVKNGCAFLNLFSSNISPLDLLFAYAMFSRGKDSEALSILVNADISKHVLLELSSLHMMLRLQHFWGNQRILSTDIPDESPMPALIPARGNSKGIAQKNLVQMGGTSLLEIAISKAQASRYISRVIVDTDDRNIADKAREAGAEVLYLRPEKLGTDFSDLSDVRVLATHWLELMEGYWFEHLAVITPPHPLWPVSEFDRACRKFFTSGCTSLVSVTPTEMLWDAYYSIEKYGVQCIAKRKFGELYGRNGSFSLFSRKPAGQYSSFTYRKLYPTHFKTMVYPLSREHGYDINRPEELEICKQTNRALKNILPATPDDLKHAIAKIGTNLATRDDAPVFILHYPEVQHEYYVDKTPASLFLLNTLTTHGVAGKYIVCGTSDTAKTIAEYYNLPRIIQNSALIRNGMISKRVLKEVECEFSQNSGIVYINGYGGLIESRTIEHVIDTIKTDERAFCTTLRKADIPPQWVLQKKNGKVLPLMKEHIGFRQMIDETYVQSRMLAGYGVKINVGKSFTHHVILHGPESLLLGSVLNTIEASLRRKITIH